MFPKTVPMEKYSPSPEPLAYLVIYVCQSPQKISPPTKWEKTLGHRPRSPTQTEGLHTLVCGLVPQGDH